MKLKLKEDPREWQKFILILVLAISALAFWLHLRRGLPTQAFSMILIGAGLLAVACGVQRRWSRALYRAAMTASYHVGQVLGFVLLLVIFFVIVTPLGWALRILGKDLLHVKPDPQASTFWCPCRGPSPLDRLF